MTCTTAFSPRRLAAVALAVLLLAGMVLIHQLQADEAPPQKPALTPEQRERLKEGDRYGAESAELQSQGKILEAIAAAEKRLAIEREVLGDVHPDVADCLASLVTLHTTCEEFDAARKAAQEVVILQTRLHGEKAWQATDAHLALADVDRLARLEPAARRRLAEAEQLDLKVGEFLDQGKFADAMEPARKALQVRKELLGDKHLDYASSLSTLALLYQLAGRCADAEPLDLQCLDICGQALGEKHPNYAASLGNLARLYEDMGDFAKAEPPCRQALDVYKEALGDKHPDYAYGLNELAGLYLAMGDYAKAGPLCRQAVEVGKQALGEKHPRYAKSLDNLATYFYGMGDYAGAERLFREALEIRKQAFGDKHYLYADSLGKMAGLYGSVGDYVKAEPLYFEALEIDKQTFGEKHASYAADLAGLAKLYLDMGDYDKAGPLCRKAAEIRKEVVGDKSSAYADSLNDLAVLYRDTGDYTKAEALYLQAQEVYREAHEDDRPYYALSLNSLAVLYTFTGDYAKAEPLYRQALDLRKSVLGVKHPEYAVSLDTLALLYASMGDYGKAEPLCRQALDSYRGSLELTSAAQSERQQLAMTQHLRTALDYYLSLAPAAHQPAKAVYEPVLAWKGAVSARQQGQRLQSKRPELAEDLAKLQSASSRLATLAFAVPDPKQQEARWRQIQDLTEEKERLESALAGRSAEFRRQQDLRVLSPAQLQEVLPKDAALVDFLEYTQSKPSPTDKGKWIQTRRLAAFVVRPDSVEQLDLGLVEPVADAIDRWRARVQFGRAAKDQPDPGAELRRLIWLPLEDRLQGVKTVLISPDGALARLPLAALPGSKPDGYLIEDVAVAVVPVPQLLPDLLARREKEDKSEPSLLLLGDVDYGAETALADARGDSRSAVRGGAGALLSFPALEGTREEIVAVKDSFEANYPEGRVNVLRKEMATEGAVKEQAPKCRWLHLATHGFFAPEELRSALAPRAEGKGELAAPGGDPFGPQGVSGFNPGLLSGLALAGANHAAVDGREDGVLTAVEVAEMDLSGVDLATLSACETGLGKTAGGEGVLGLQRAFQAAGARSVISSLWSVDDEATRKLMVRFYGNLWRAKRPMGKLEALREAQLWMLREGRKDAGVQRGVKRHAPDDIAEPTGRLAPYYWAAFVLSGDWR